MLGQTTHWLLYGCCTEREWGRDGGGMGEGWGWDEGGMRAELGRAGRGDTGGKGGKRERRGQQ